MNDFDQPDDSWLSPDDVFVDLGEKVRRGYDPEVIDRHLNHLAAGIKALRREVDTIERIDDESLQVMMRAGRRSVEEALEEARVRAETMISGAEREAAQLLSEAHVNANEIRLAGEAQIKDQDEVIEIRRIEIAALDEIIDMRQKALRAAAAELLRLADGIVDETDEPRPTDEETDDSHEADEIDLREPVDPVTEPDGTGEIDLREPVDPVTEPDSGSTPTDSATS